MLPGWNSIEAVSFLQNLFTILSYVSLGALLFFEVAAHVYGSRKETLLDEVSKKKDALVQELKTQLQSEQNTIRGMTANISIRFQGKWNERDPPFTDSVVMAPPGDTQFLQMVAPANGDLHYVNLYGTKMYRFLRHSDGDYSFLVNTSLKPDSVVIGQSIESLREISTGAVVFLPVVYPNKLADPEINISSVKIDFAINGKMRTAKIFEHAAKVKPTQIPENRFVPIAIPLTGEDIINPADHSR
jgi:hypothetical protein